MPPAQPGPGGEGAAAAASAPRGEGRSGAAAGGAAPALGGDYFVPWHIPFHRADAARALAGLQARGAPSPSASKLQGEGAARAAAAPEAGDGARSGVGEPAAGPHAGRPRALGSRGDGGRQPAQASDTAALVRGRGRSRRGAPQEAGGAARSEQGPNSDGDGQRLRPDARARTEAALGDVGCTRECPGSDRAQGCGGSAPDWAAATPDPGAGVPPRDDGAAAPASGRQPSPDGQRCAPSPDDARCAGRPATPWAVDAGKRAVVVQRYCHLYGAGELEALVASLPGAAVASSCYDRSNWCVVMQMGRAPDAPAA